MKKILIILFFIFITVSLNANNIDHYKLKNGLTVILVEKHTVPLVTAQIWVKAGSITEEEYAGCGISHYIEHLLFTTTKKHTGEYIARKVKELGGDMNGYTSFEETVFHFTFGSENLNKILPIMKEMIFEPAFKDSELKKEKNVILKEINMNIDDPARFFSKLIFFSAYEKSYFKFPVIGYAELFKKIKRSDVIKYYTRMYVPDNMALIIVGDFNIPKIKPDIKNIFGSIKRKPVHTVSLIPEPASTGFRSIIKYRSDIRFPRLALVWKTVDIRNKDLFALDVLSLIIGNGKSSILNKKIKEKSELVKSISSYSYTPMQKGIFFIEATPYRSRDIEIVFQKVFLILKNLEKNVPTDILEKAKKITLVNYLSGKESIRGTASDIGINWISTGNLNFSEYYVNNIKKVTKKDIKRVIKKYFTKDNLTAIKLLPEKDKPKLNQRKEIFNQGNNIEEITLKNNIKLLVYKDMAAKLMSINILFKGGLLFEKKEKHGITYFLSKLLLSGTKKYSREKILKIFENNGGSISTFAGNNSFGIRTLFLKEDLKKVLPVLNSILSAAKFPNSEIERNRKEILSELSSVKEKLFGIGKIKLFSIFYKGLPYEDLKMGNEKSIKNISKFDLIKYYKKFICNNNVVVSIAGAVKNRDIKLIKKNFQKKIKLSAKKLVIPPLKTLPVNKNIVFSTNIKKTQSLMFISYYGTTVNSRDRYKEELLWYILNGQGSRLFVNLREKKELAYYVGFFPFYGLSSGLINFYIGTIKSKIKTAEKGMRKEIAKLIKNGITEKELTAAKREAISDRFKEFEGVNNIAFNIGLNKLYNIKDITIKAYKNKISKITKNDINEFIKKYLKDKPSGTLFILGK